MALLTLLFLLAWTLVVVRALGARATLSDRTFALFLPAGAIIGILGFPLSLHLFATYGDINPFTVFLRCIGFQLLLIAPAAITLRYHRLYAATTIADAFLLAFCTGFGFQVFVALLSFAGTPIKGYASFPPWQVGNGDITAAGEAYWTALVVMAWAAGKRLSPRPFVAWALSAVALVYVVLEQTALQWYANSPVLALFLKLTFHGGLTGLLVLVGVVALSLIEANWVARALGGGARFEVLESWENLLRLLFRQRFAEFVMVYRLYGLRRQSRLIHAEAVGSPGDPALERYGRLADAQLAAAEASYGGPPSGVIAPETVPPSRTRSVSKRQLGVVSIVAVVLLVCLVALSAPKFASFLWALPVLTATLPLFPTSALNVIAATYVVWRFIAAISAEPAPGDPDGSARQQARRVALYAAFVAVLAVFVYVRVEDLYPFWTPTMLVGEGQFGDLSRRQFATVLMLAAVLTAYAAAPAAKFDPRTVTPQRRAGVLGQLTAALSLAAVTWVGVAAYQPIYLGLRQTGSFEFRPSDFTDPKGLATRLNANADPVSQYVRGQTADPIWQSLQRFAVPPAPGDIAPPTPVETARLGLANAFNAMVANTDLYDAQRFTGVSLPDETRPLIAQSAVGLAPDDLVRLNRRLLESAFPGQITVRHPPFGPVGNPFFCATVASLLSGLICLGAASLLRKASQSAIIFLVGRPA